MDKSNPRNIYIFSGKRKSGKDYFTEKLCSRFSPKEIHIVRLSAPIKSHYATMNGLDFNKLLGSTEYKESYRKGMLEWSEKIRNEDYGYFCRAAIKMSDAESKPIWIISDARRKTDLLWFKENYGNKVKKFRIVCDDDTRRQRGWVFTEGIDDKETECGLDDVSDWDGIIENNGKNDLEQVINKFADDINELLL